jgi:hypothetical protein
MSYFRSGSFSQVCLFHIVVAYLEKFDIGCGFFPSQNIEINFAT